jgi:hypothetical protein
MTRAQQTNCAANPALFPRVFALTRTAAAAAAYIRDILSQSNNTPCGGSGRAAATLVAFSSSLRAHSSSMMCDYARDSCWLHQNHDVTMDALECAPAEFTFPPRQADYFVSVHILRRELYVAVSPAMKTDVNILMQATAAGIVSLQCVSKEGQFIRRT